MSLSVLDVVAFSLLSSRQVSQWSSGSMHARLPCDMIRVRILPFVPMIVPIMIATATSAPTQPSELRGTGNEHLPKCGDAVRLGSKGKMAHSAHVDKRVGGR